MGMPSVAVAATPSKQLKSDMPKISETLTLPLEPAASPYESLEIYTSAVREYLKKRDELSPAWIEELLEGDSVFLSHSFDAQNHPAAAALEIFITEEESAREPAQADLRLKLRINETAKAHLKRLVELGLWGESVEDAAERLLEQSLAAKLESGLLRTSYQK